MKNVFLESHNIKNLYSGLGQFNYHLIKALHRAENKQFKFTINTKRPKIWKKEFGEALGYNRYHSASRYKLFRTWKKYDLWHSLNQNTKIEPARDLPYLMTVHDVHFLEGPATHEARKKRFMEKLNRSRALVYISEFARTSTHELFDIPEVPEYVIYNGNPVQEEDDDPNHKPAYLPQQKFLFNIGEMAPRKNIHSLVAMLQFLPDYHLLLAGNTKRAYYSTVLETIEKYQLQKRVHVLGKITEADKKFYLKHCIAFVFPSLREGFGIPPIEAMTYGKPVFLARRSSLPEIGGDVAYYWDHFDAEYMARILNKGIEEYNADPIRSQEQIKKHAAKFSWDKSAEEYLKIYEQLLN